MAYERWRVVELLALVEEAEAQLLRDLIVEENKEKREDVSLLVRELVYWVLLID